VLACRPETRPDTLWPDDIVDLAEALLLARRVW
jgi:hypothetical protein